MINKILLEVIPHLIRNGVFGEVKFISASSESSSLAPQFQSTIFFVKIVIADKENPSKQQKISVIVKVQKRDENIRNIRNSSLMFNNEVIMYNNILPFIGVSNLTPKCYYAHSSKGKEPDKDIVILENLSKQGFTISKLKWFLDIEHVSSSVKKLAEYHAMSLNKKFEDNEGFLNHVKKLKRVIFKETAEYSHEKLCCISMERGINYLLLKNPQHREVLEKFLNLIQNVNLFYESLFKPEEPFSVVCHGDFLKNNIFYFYDNSGNVTECRFFDFQYSLYTTPAMDLSLFLYMHTTQEIRRSHWNDILRLYWNTVRKNVPSHIPLSSFDEFHRHFSERAVIAYAPCSFFVPMMAAEKDVPSLETFLKLTFAEKTKIFLESGGDLGTRLIADIVLHFLEEKYLLKFFDLFK